jgi:hypothetical protein
MLSEDDRIGWNRVVSLRNRMAHEGPGFLDSVDLRAGRIWREYEIDDRLTDKPDISGQSDGNFVGLRSC